MKPFSTSPISSNGLAHVVVQTAANAPADRTWNLLTDWSAHERWIPFTVIQRGPPPATGIGSSFVARTGFGPFRMADPMTVTAWQPPTAGQPGHCELQKSGRWILGSASLQVEPGSDGRIRITWTEDIGVRWVPPVCNGVVQVTGRLLFGLTLRRAGRELDAG